MFLFVLFYSIGQGPGTSVSVTTKTIKGHPLTLTVAFAYSSEVFPLLNREAGMSFSVSYRAVEMITVNAQPSGKYLGHTLTAACL